MFGVNAARSVPLRCNCSRDVSLDLSFLSCGSASAVPGASSVSASHVRLSNLNIRRNQCHMVCFASCFLQKNVLISHLIYMIKQKWPFSSAENTGLTLPHNCKKFALFDKYGTQMKSVASYVYLYKKEFIHQFHSSDHTANRLNSGTVVDSYNFPDIAWTGPNGIHESSENPAMLITDCTL